MLFRTKFQDFEFSESTLRSAVNSNLEHGSVNDANSGSIVSSNTGAAISIAVLASILVFFVAMDERLFVVTALGVSKVGDRRADGLAPEETSQIVFIAIFGVTKERVSHLRIDNRTVAYGHSQSQRRKKSFAEFLERKKISDRKRSWP
ncbi:hypothetical protein EVAR_44303_1 [Eumeta japonica]|uniref:Uncharacterized protein n=1 Tax=Eumeta variegata TaxID=151549 RepID=A0A4C1WRX1_EUMVA|nr:hypothetical protein EVAR_44303_1 [Eumeta japonica]